MKFEGDSSHKMFPSYLCMIVQQIFRSQAIPRTRTIRCAAGILRSQSIQSRGSMFQAPQPSNSVFSLQSTREDANETISLDPAIKERGQAQIFNESLFEDSDTFDEGET